MLQKFIDDLKEKDTSLAIRNFLTPELERYFIGKFLMGMSQQHLKGDRPDQFKIAMSFAYADIANQIGTLPYASDCDSERQQVIELAWRCYTKELEPLKKFGYNQVAKRLLQKIHYDACTLNGTIGEFLNFIGKQILEN